MPWAGCADCERIVVKSPVHTIKSKALRALDMVVSREATEVDGPGREGALVPNGDLRPVIGIFITTSITEISTHLDLNSRQRSGALVMSQADNKYWGAPLLIPR